MRSIAQLKGDVENCDDDSEDGAEFAEATEAINPSEMDEDASSTHRPLRRQRIPSTSTAPVPPPASLPTPSSRGRGASSGSVAPGGSSGGGNAQWWTKTVERALVALSAEVAALREQIASGREWRTRRERNLTSWLRWLLWSFLRHALVDLAALAVVLLTMRRFAPREDSSQLEEHVRAIFKLGRDFVVRYLLP